MTERGLGAASTSWRGSDTSSGAGSDCGTMADEERRTCLLLIDPQNDFFESGSLPVAGASDIIPVINKLRRREFTVTIIAMDWHPVNHCSFSSNNPGAKLFESINLPSTGMQIMWPDHCVQETDGAALHDDLIVRPSDIFVRAGLNPHSDSYSAFRDNVGKAKTPLLDILKRESIDELYCCGLALDYCVQFTALDAAMLSSADVFVVRDGCAGLRPEAVREAMLKFRQEGVTLIDSDDPRITSLAVLNESPLPPIAAVADASPDESATVEHTYKLVEYLHNAIMALDVGKVHGALSHGADREKRPLPLGHNALHLASFLTVTTHSNQARILQIIKLLLDGAPTGYVDSLTVSNSPFDGGYSALMLASSKGHVQVVDALLAVGADLTIACKQEGLTALMLASRGGHAEVAAIIMAEGGASTLAYSTKFGKTALMYACSAVDTSGRTAFGESTEEWKERNARRHRSQAHVFPGSDVDIAVLSGSDTGVWGRVTKSIARHLSVLKALADGLRSEDFLALLKQQDCDGWTSLHFSAKTGLLPHVPWRMLLGDDLVMQAGVEMLTNSNLSVLHLAAWNRQHGCIATLLHHMRGYSLEFSPWRLVLPKELAAGPVPHTAVDLALAREDWASTSLGLRARVPALVKAGPLMDECLERALLQMDAKAMEALLAMENQGVQSESAAVDLIQLIKFENACTFSFAGYNNPIRQHRYHCVTCDRSVCLVCASTCHVDGRAGETHSLERLGFSDEKTYCGCARHSCRAGAPEERSMYSYVPKAVDTTGIKLVVRDGAIVDASTDSDRRKRPPQLRLHQQVNSPPAVKEIESEVDLLASELGIRDEGEIASPGMIDDEPDEVADLAAELGLSDELQVAPTREAPISPHTTAARSAGAGTSASGTAGGGGGGVSRAAGQLSIMTSHEEESRSPGLLDAASVDGGSESSRLADDAATTELLSHLVNVMARQAHTVWAIEKVMDRWRYHKVRDNAKKHHPLLKPYDELEEADGEYNRQASLKSLKLIAALKFQIRPPPSKGSGADWGIGQGTITDEMAAEAARSGGATAALLRRLGIDRVDTSDVRLKEEHRTLVSLIARNYHEEWACEQMAKGYVFAPEQSTAKGEVGADDDDAASRPALTNHLLVPFELLPASYQQSNRNAAESLVKLLLKLGNTLTPTSLEEYSAINAAEGELVNKEAAMLRHHQELRIELRARFWTALLLRAARHGDSHLIQRVMMVKSSVPAPNVNCLARYVDLTPLHLAARNGHMATVKKLIHLGSRIEAQDCQGLTPLAAAAFSRQSRVVRLLLKMGANPTTSDAFGLTPLHHAAYNGASEVAKLILRQLHRLKEAGELETSVDTTDIRESARMSFFANRSKVASISAADMQGATTISDLHAGGSPSAVAAAARNRSRSLALNNDDIENRLSKRRQSRARLVREAVISGSADHTDNLEGVVLIPEEALGELQIDPESVASQLPGDQEPLPPLSTQQRIRLALLCRRRHSAGHVYSRYCLARGDGILARPISRLTPLALAVKARRTEMVQLLLKYGANPNKPDLSGITPYERALRAHVSAQWHRAQLGKVIAEHSEQQRLELERQRADVARARDSVAVVNVKNLHFGEYEDDIEVVLRHRRQAAETRKREAAFKKFGRRTKEGALLLNLLNSSPFVHGARRSFALWEVALRVVVFAFVVSSGAIVSPFAPDYDLATLHDTTVSMRSSLESSGFTDISNIGEWWSWATNSFVGEVGDNASFVLQQRARGAVLTAMGSTVVGPVQLSVDTLMWSDSESLSAGVGDLLSTEEVDCYVRGSMQDALGMCGGIGPQAVEPRSDVVLARHAMILTGGVAEISTALQQVKDREPFVQAATTRLTLHLSLFSPTANVWMGAELGADVHGAGSASGSVSPTVDVQGAYLFTDRFPSSVLFELVLTAVLVLQVIGFLVTWWSHPNGMAAVLKKSSTLYDLLLFGLLATILVVDWVMRTRMETAGEAIEALAPSEEDLDTNGAEPAAGSPFIEIMAISRLMHDQTDLISLTFLLGSTRVIKYLRILPSLGPMLVAVLSTLSSSIVLLYLSLLAGTMIIFGIAFHVAVGAQAAAFSTIPTAIVSLFTLTLGEVSILDEAPERLSTTLLFLSFVMILAIVMLNLFIGVITDVYPAAKRHSERDWDDLITGMLQSPFMGARRLRSNGANRGVQVDVSAADAALGGSTNSLHSGSMATATGGSAILISNQAKVEAKGKRPSTTTKGKGELKQVRSKRRTLWQFGSVPRVTLSHLMTPRGRKEGGDTKAAKADRRKNPKTATVAPVVAVQIEDAKAIPSHGSKTSMYSSFSSVGEPERDTVSPTRRPGTGTSLTFGMGVGVGFGAGHDRTGSLKWDGSDFADHSVEHGESKRSAAAFDLGFNAVDRTGVDDVMAMGRGFATPRAVATPRSLTGRPTSRGSRPSSAASPASRHSVSVPGLPVLEDDRRNVASTATRTHNDELEALLEDSEEETPGFRPPKRKQPSATVTAGRQGGGPASTSGKLRSVSSDMNTGLVDGESEEETDLDDEASDSDEDVMAMSSRPATVMGGAGSAADMFAPGNATHAMSLSRRGSRPFLRRVGLKREGSILDLLNSMNQRLAEIEGTASRKSDGQHEDGSRPQSPGSRRVSNVTPKNPSPRATPKTPGSLSGSASFFFEQGASESKKDK